MSMTPTPQMQVTAAPRYSARLRITLVILLVLSAAGLGFVLGLVHADMLQTEVTNLRASNAQLAADLAAKDGALIDAELEGRVDDQTAELLKASLKETSNQLAALKEEVTFYRSLMAPSSLERGLQIARFELLPDDDDASQFRYELLLTQVEARRSFVQGQVRVDVVGERDGQEEVLSLTDLAQLDTYPLKYRFRYFQDFSGEVRIPDEFVPLRVLVTVTQRGRKEDHLQRLFDWQA